MPDRLDRYRAKRDPERTPEPFGPAEAAARADAPRLFVVQKHAARRLHWDFRLELGGTLRSWAVPEGAVGGSRGQAHGRRGRGPPDRVRGLRGDDPRRQLRRRRRDRVGSRGRGGRSETRTTGSREGKLVFELSGYKLHGEWTLVRTRRDQGGKQQWLLLKHRGDAWAGPGGRSPRSPCCPGGSSRSSPPARVARGRRSRGGAARGAAPRRSRRRTCGRCSPRRATRRSTRTGWLFELKYDGYRLLARARGRARRAALPERRGRDGALPGGGEGDRAAAGRRASSTARWSCSAPDGRPSFQALQERAQLSRPRRRRARRGRAAGDLLRLRSPRARRARRARRCRSPSASALLAERRASRSARCASPSTSRGAARTSTARCARAGSRGSSRSGPTRRTGPAAPPRGSRSASRSAGDFAVVGFTAPAAARARGSARCTSRSTRATGSCYAGQRRDRLQTTRSSTSSTRGSQPRARTDAALPRAPSRAAAATRGWSRSSCARCASASGRRRGSCASRCSCGCARTSARGCAARGGAPHEGPPPVPRPARASAAACEVTNGDKVFWFPADGITKARRGRLLPRDRAVHAAVPRGSAARPDPLPRRHRREELLPEGRAGVAAGLDPHGAHPQRGRRPRPRPLPRGRRGRPRLDREPRHDPPARLGEPGRRARAAGLVRRRSRSQGARRSSTSCGSRGRSTRSAARSGSPPYPKTTGQKGLHVLVPLGGQLTHEQSRTLGELLARAIEAELPEISTTARAIAARGGRVYLDFMQNGYGKTIVAPYAVRPRPGAPVSTPLRWSEVTARLDPVALHHPQRPRPGAAAPRRSAPAGPLREARPRRRARGAARPHGGREPGSGAAPLDPAPADAAILDLRRAQAGAAKGRRPPRPRQRSGRCRARPRACLRDPTPSAPRTIGQSGQSAERRWTISRAGLCSRASIEEQSRHGTPIQHRRHHPRDRRRGRRPRLLRHRAPRRRSRAGGHPARARQERVARRPPRRPGAATSRAGSPTPGPAASRTSSSRRPGSTRRRRSSRSSGRTPRSRRASRCRSRRRVGARRSARRGSATPAVDEAPHVAGRARARRRRRRDRPPSPRSRRRGGAALEPSAVGDANASTSTANSNPAPSSASSTACASASDAAR